MDLFNLDHPGRARIYLAFRWILSQEDFAPSTKSTSGQYSLCPDAGDRNCSRLLVELGIINAAPNFFQTESTWKFSDMIPQIANHTGREGEFCTY